MSTLLTEGLGNGTFDGSQQLLLLEGLSSSGDAPIPPFVRPSTGLAMSIEDDATAIFTSTYDFAEQVIYTPSGGSGRTVNAVVVRDGLQIFGESGAELYTWQVHLANGVDGIDSTEIDLGNDTITLSPRDGENMVPKTITKIIFQDHGMLVVECR